MSDTWRGADWLDLPWRRRTFDSGVPRVPVSDAVLGWSLPVLTTGLLVAAAVSVRPLGGAGRGAYGLALLVGCGVVGYSRSLPDRVVPPRTRLVLAVLGVVLAGLLFGFDSGSWAVSFAYLSTGHVGVRFRPPLALVLAGGCVAVCLGALVEAAHDGSAHNGSGWPWWTALTVAGPVVTGLARQERARTLRSAHELVEQTRRATESERRASALDERARVARDIHDVLAHSLSGVSVQLDLADALLEAGRVEQGRAGVQAARGLVVAGLVEARRAVQMLRDGALDVAESLHWMVQPPEELRLSGQLDGVSAPVAQAVVRIVQEALTNARRHAPGAGTLVEVSRGAGAVTVDVLSGAGNGAVAGAGSGMGLVGIRERVAEVGGSCLIGPETEGPYAGGWRVHAVLPAPPAPPG